MYTKEWRADRKAKGLCIKCLDGVTVTGRSRCQNCLDKQREINKQCYDRGKRNGTCKICGKKSVKNKRCCKSCSERLEIKYKETYRKRKQEGFCTTCGKCEARAGYCDCTICAARSSADNKKRRAKWIKKGLCSRCGGQGLAGNTIDCEICILKQLAVRLWKKRNHWLKLKQLFEEQQGICPYLKQVLTIGKNASIDHIMPKSKGGTHDMTNLQWVHCDVNIMKWNQTHEEFIQRICLIAKNHEKVYSAETQPKPS